MIAVLSSGALATVQDLGRRGALHWGVGTAGAMDPLALAAGNVMLGNDEGAAGVEVQVFPFAVRFDAPCRFAVTGADGGATLDGAPLPPWWCTAAEAGQVLRLGPPRPGPHRAARAYLCVAGGIDVPPVLGSRSTQLRGAFGGYEGRALREGDRLAPAAPGVGASPGAGAAPGDGPAGFGLVPPAVSLAREADGCPAIRALPAAEHDSFTPASLDAFWSEPWKITPQSDRYGYRLAGTPLEPRAPLELRSHGIVPGVIQVPPGGQPIVQMRDAQPSGGYPKIGTVIEADLWRLGQAPIGSRVRFVRVGWDEAVAAGAAVERWLGEARRLVGLHRARGL